MAYARIRNHSCTECKSHPIIVVSEFKTEYRMMNPLGKTICVTKMDGCYLKNCVSCDFLIVNCDDKKAYFVELKGSDVFRALEQVEKTLEEVREDLSGYQCFARVVPTKVPVPNIRNNPKTMRTRKAFSNLGGDLGMKSVLFIEAV